MLPHVGAICAHYRQPDELDDIDDLVMASVPKLLVGLPTWRPDGGLRLRNFLWRIVSESCSIHRRLGPLGIRSTVWRSISGERPPRHYALTERSRQKAFEALRGLRYQPEVDQESEEPSGWSDVEDDRPNPTEQIMREEDRLEAISLLDEARSRMSEIEREGLDRAFKGLVAHRKSGCRACSSPNERALENGLYRALDKIRRLMYERGMIPSPHHPLPPKWRLFEKALPASGYRRQRKVPYPRGPQKNRRD